MKVVFGFGLFLSVATSLAAGEISGADRRFLEQHCYECHDTETAKGGLDLTTLQFDLANPTNFSRWVLIHDRVNNGEMPPKKKPRPEETMLAAFTQSLSTALVSAERARMAKEGRATQR